MNRPLSLLTGIVALGLLAASPAFGVVTLTSTGFAGQNEKNSTNTANVPAGAAFLLVADTGTAGFGAFTTNTIPNGASINVGSLLDGDTIFYRSTDAIAGASNVNISNLDVTALAGLNFALLWFNTATGATTNLATGDQYGIVTDPTWVLPTVSSTLGFATSPSASNPYLTQTAPGAASLTVGAVPEPSTSLLALLGGMGLMMRRRRN